MDRIRCALDLQGAQSESRFRGIGRYSLNLAKALVQLAGDHEIWIILNGLFPDTIEPLRAIFGRWIPQERIVTFTAPRPVAEFETANAWRRSAAERIREHFLAALAPDVVHVSSIFEGFVDDAVTSIGTYSSSFPSAATLYDLIPLMRPEQYLFTAAMREHYLRKAQMLKKAEMLLSISESSRREAVDVLHVPAERIVNISTGIDELFRIVALSPDEVSAVHKRFGISRHFIMYSGAIDTRKNIAGLIQAFALLPASVRENHQLVIVGKHDNSGRDWLRELGRGAGLRGDEIVFPGFVEDSDLVALYNLCSLFVLPSFHEGFGMPALEAMACGSPTITANTTSLPEVIGMAEALFDPQQPAAIAEKMYQVLTDDSFRDTLRQHGLRQCKQFTWDSSAKAAWSVFEELHLRNHSTQEYVLSPRTYRRSPRLAYFSPLPPERSGIADYSAELLPELARFYEIEVILQQETVGDDWISANFPVRDTAYFELNVTKYDRVLYHIGNSPFHIYMLDILRRRPGVVVLHDFYQTAVLNWMDLNGGAPGRLWRAIYESHGYSGLLLLKENGREFAVRTLPCNRHIIDPAAGVIVHSEFSRRLADQWYGARTASNWKRVPFGRAPRRKDRVSSRERLGIAQDDYVVCSFGLADPTKLSARILSGWLNANFSCDRSCNLLFVGENCDAEYGRTLVDRIVTSGFGNRIRITGFVPRETYRDYLAAADCAVQLRTDSRGETSAALYDCLASGVPTIINSNGSFSETPDSVVFKLPEEFTDAQLSAALEQMFSDADLRRTLGQRAQQLMRTEHHPAHVAELYRDAIESFATSHPIAREQHLLRDIATISSHIAPTHRDLEETARAIATQRRDGLHQLLLDVSAVAKHDLKTGIERAACNLAMQFMRSSINFRAEPIRYLEEQRIYARKWAFHAIGVEMEPGDSPVEFRSGDVYLSLDWSPEAVTGSCEFFSSLRAHNIPIFFVVYDLLPILRPEMFPGGASDEFRRWLETLCEFSDGMACISKSVADELLCWLDAIQPSRLRPLKVGYFHLGADIEELESPKGLPADADDVLAALRARPSILMVGTIEPRKGHAQTLAAFERLWAADIQANLVIVGHEGWGVEPVLDRIANHRERGKRLFWLPDASDEMLLRLYAGSSVLLAASEGEGFGLPLIEAARCNTPIIARDIPVFREVAGEHAYYFEGTTPESLASAIVAWLELRSRELAPLSRGMRWLSWKECAGQLMEVVDGRRIYREWLPSKSRAVDTDMVVSGNKTSLPAPEHGSPL